MIDISRAGKVGIVSINRPPVNALNDETYQAIIHSFDQLSRDDSVNAVILSSTGTRAFCAGTDMNDFSLRHTDDPEWHERHSKLVRQAFDAIYRCPVPVVAAVQAVSVGAGMGLLASCDFVLAAESASFGLPEIDRGVLGGARHLRRMVPEGIMRYMAFTGERLSAEAFLSFGGAFRVVPDRQLQDEAVKVATMISKKSPVALRALKGGLNHIELCSLNLTEGYRYEQSLTGSIANHPIPTAAENPLLKELSAVVKMSVPDIGEVASAMTPLHMTESGVSFSLPPPSLGEQTDEILREAGYDAEAVARLRADGVVGPVAHQPGDGEQV
jgi:enoyl-CoA hydratase